MRSITTRLGESKPYQIRRVKQTWRKTEHMGSKKKFWFRFEEDNSKWLFKFPRRNTGEHWAEKISGEVAKLLDFKHAVVKLATTNGALGTVTKSFLEDGESLHHGNEILEQYVSNYDRSKRFHQSRHTIENIFSALTQAFKDESSARNSKIQIGTYFVLDALVGNTDRHHENWGIRCRSEGTNLLRSLAPSYDHASSLGRELMDQRRDRILKDKSIHKYSAKGRGAVYWKSDTAHGPSPLDLVRRSAPRYSEIFAPSFDRIRDLDEESLKQSVDRIPTGWMTEAARKFAIDLMCYNLSRLREIGC